MLCFTVRLRLGAYDAAMVDDPLSPEWPPHPARLFCALVAGDPTADEWDALRWLESQSAPEVHASGELTRQSPEQFLVTNRTDAAGGSQTGRRQTVRVKPRLLPARRQFHVVWSAEPSADHRASLAALARRVPYVGRVTADAEVHVGDRVESDDALDIYEPVELRDAEVDLRVPYPGYSDRLSAAYEDGRRAAYRRRPETITSSAEPIGSPFESLLVFAIDGRSHLGASHTAKVTEQLRRAVIRLMEDGLGMVAPMISGHGADHREHVAYLALPNVGTPARLPGENGGFVARNAHADGRLLGVALAIPRCELSDTTALHRCLVGSATPLDHLTLGSSGVVPLRAVVSGDAYTLAPLRWTSPSRWWATTTPVVLDRFPKPGRDDVAELVAHQREGLVHRNGASV
jgi:CRISPR-associated protein Csb2